MADEIVALKARLDDTEIRRLEGLERADAAEAENKRLREAWTHAHAEIAKLDIEVCRRDGPAHIRREAVLALLQRATLRAPQAGEGNRS